MCHLHPPPPTPIPATLPFPHSTTALASSRPTPNPLSSPSSRLISSRALLLCPHTCFPLSPHPPSLGLGLIIFTIIPLPFSVPHLFVTSLSSSFSPLLTFIHLRFSFHLYILFFFFYRYFPLILVHLRFSLTLARINISLPHSCSLQLPSFVPFSLLSFILCIISIAKERKGAYSDKADMRGTTFGNCSDG